MILAHLHVQPCPCSRCRVARNYARLLATVADGPEADAAQPLAAELSVPGEGSERRDLDAVRHLGEPTPV